MELSDVITWCGLPITASGICQFFAGSLHESMIKGVRTPGAVLQALVPGKHVVWKCHQLRSWRDVVDGVTPMERAAHLGVLLGPYKTSNLYNHGKYNCGDDV